MTIATSDSNGNPWISNIYFAFDSQMNIYWYSPKKSRHSNYIKDNPNIAISIFNSTAVGEEVKAVYIKAKAQEVTNKNEILKSLIPYGEKMLKTGFIPKENLKSFLKSYMNFQNISPLRMYKAIPYEISLLADSKMYRGLYVDSRIVIKEG